MRAEASFTTHVVQGDYHCQSDMHLMSDLGTFDQWQSSHLRKVCSHVSTQIMVNQLGFFG